MKKILTLILASFFDNHLKNIAIWSQLECLCSKFEKIIISAPVEHKENVTNLIKDVQKSMPETYSKILTSFHINDRYDTGLWCDGLASMNKNTSSQFGKVKKSFLLSNDSLLILKKMDYIPNLMKDSNKDLISLNYWDTEENSFWVESPFRIFSENGIQLFNQNICNLGKINWRKHCPHLKKYKGHWHSDKFKKRCIVEKTEIDVAFHFERVKVDGIYPGYAKYRKIRRDGRKYKNWAEDYRTWKNMKDNYDFPVIKVTKEHLINEFFDATKKEEKICLSLLPNHYKTFHF